MAEANTYHQPRCYIDNKEIIDEIKGQVSFPGNNQLNNIQLTISNPDLQHQALLYKTIKYYLNNGSLDSVAFFTGIITQINPNEKFTNIIALDPRILIHGENGYTINITDKQNYDGYTLGAYLYSFISTYVNSETTKLGVDMLSDTNPTISLSGVRDNYSVYGLALEKIKEEIDDDDYLNPLGYFFDVIEDYTAPQLVIKKEKLTTSTPALTFSYGDGLSSYSYTRRNTPNIGRYKNGEFKYTSRPCGDSVIDISADLASPDEQRSIAIKQILLEQQTKEEISLQVTKAYDIGLGTIVRLNVPEDDISGNHRVVSKSVTFGKSSKCSLKLNKPAPKLSDYVPSQMEQKLKSL